MYCSAVGTTLRAAPLAEEVLTGQGVRELDRLGAAFESEPDKRVGHETLAESGVYRSEHEISVGGPDRIRRALARYCRLCAECRHAERAATPDREVGSSYAE